MMLSKVSRSLVACNVYVSAGGNPNHRDLLLNLLGETQELCRIANSNNNNNNNKNPAVSHSLLPTGSDQRVVVVHAFRDGPYDRSSFHLAGSPDLVADVGSLLAKRAVEAVLRFEKSSSPSSSSSSSSSSPLLSKEKITNGCHSNETREEKESSTGKQRHPTVGVVDHVSVLPLTELSSNGNTETENGIGNSIGHDGAEEISVVAGSVARTIGENLRSSGAEVFYYGHAHPSGKELAAVRRDSTRFFRDVRTADTDDALTAVVVGQATVGAPGSFVENFNIRLRPGVSRRVARTLTESVRERSGRGLPFVEALTLAYGRDQYEVACNLLDPSVTSAGDIEERMKDWEQQQQQKQQEGGGEDPSGAGLVDTAYRVGTTTDMCLKALMEVSTEEGERSHNKRVFERLEAYFIV